MVVRMRCKPMQQQTKERDYRLLHELPIKKTLSNGHSKNAERRCAAHK